MNHQLPAIIVILPLVASFLIFFSGWWLKRAAYPLAVTALVCDVLFAIGILTSVISEGVIHYWMGGWAPPWGIEYYVDQFNAYMLVLVTFLSLFTAIYARRTVETEIPDRIGLFWCLFLLLNTGILGIIITGDLFNLFVLLEVAALTSYSLVAIGKGQAPFASLRYLIIGTIGASFYLIGIGYLYIMTGSLNMVDLRHLLPPLYGTKVVQAAFGFIFIGFGIKIALFPLHAWQPDAYTYAPSAVSVIISTAVAKTSVYALIRVIFSVFTLDFIQHFMSVFDMLCWVAAVAMIAGSIFAIVQNNFKKMLAYSSIANVGYIVLAIGLAPFTPQGLSPALIHILNHAVIKACMFMAACAFIYKFNLWDIRKFEGLGRRMPFTSFALLLAILAMIGMPPSAGFITKWNLILAVLDAQKYAFVGFIFASTLLMIVYFWRVIEIIFIRPAPVSNPSELQIEEVPLSMLVPMLILGVMTFAIGIVWMTGVLTPVLNEVNTLFGLGGALMETVASIKPLLAVIFPMLAAPCIFLAGKRPNIREGITLFAAVAQFAIVISMAPVVGNGGVITFDIISIGAGIELGYRVDALGLLFAITSSFLWILVSLYSIGYMRSLNEHAQTRYYFMFALAVFSAVSIAISKNLITFYLFYEALTLSTYWLVVHHEDSLSLAAGRKYLAYLLISGWFLFAAVVLTYAISKTTQFVDGGILSQASTSEFTLILLFVLFALGSLKAAWMPFHAWLPSAMVAPTPVSALLHAVAVVKAGVFGFVRIVCHVFGIELVGELGIGLWLGAVASLTMILGSFFAIGEDNLKRRLAFSTISQLSYILLGVALLSPFGIKGAMIHIPFHGFMKITLFLCAGAIMVVTGKKQICQLAGVGRQMPVTLLAFTIGAIGMCGAPPGVWIHQ